MKYDYKNMNTYQRIIAYCKEFGSITNKDGYNDLGTTKVSTRIGELITDYGYTFRKEPEGGVNRWGNKTSYKRYTLIGEPKNCFELPVKAD